MPLYIGSFSVVVQDFVISKFVLILLFDNVILSVQFCFCCIYCIYYLIKILAENALEGSITHFYHATLCLSAVFNVARCPSVRLSVRQSRWCIQKAEDIVKLLSRLVAP